MSSLFLPVRLTSAPSRRRILTAQPISLMSGTLSIMHGSSERRAAGRMATAEFLAALMVTSPCKRLPPLMTYFSKATPLYSFSGKQAEKGHSLLKRGISRFPAGGRPALLIVMGAAPEDGAGRRAGRGSPVSSFIFNITSIAQQTPIEKLFFPFPAKKPPAYGGGKLSAIHNRTGRNPLSVWKGGGGWAQLIGRIYKNRCETSAQLFRLCHRSAGAKTGGGEGKSGKAGWGKRWKEGKTSPACPSGGDRFLPFIP